MANFRSGRIVTSVASPPDPISIPLRLQRSVPYRRQPLWQISCMLSCPTMITFRTLAVAASLCLVYAFIQQPGMVPANTSTVPVQELAPPSELALMMRAMAAHADSVKAGLGKSDNLPPFPKQFKGLAKATPTKGMHIDEITFPTFSKDYLTKLDDLYEVPKPERAQAYNALVQSCANCHGTHCPGPLMRIRKMYAERGDQ